MGDERVWIPLTEIHCGTDLTKTGDHGDRSMLETTLARLTLAIANRDHLSLAADQLRNLPVPNVLMQPRNHDTGPGLLSCLLRLERRDPWATVAVFPSEHYIREHRAFLSHVARAIALVHRFPTRIVLLGMTPDRPEAGFGYLKPGPPLPGDAAAFRVVSFVEKPTPEMAADIIRRGGLWNSFVMVFRLDRMLTLLRRRRPWDCAVLREFDEDAYPALTPWNASRDFLAHIPTALAVLQVDEVGWSDWGTPEAIERTFRDLDLAPPWALAGSCGR